MTIYNVKGVTSNIDPQRISLQLLLCLVFVIGPFQVIVYGNEM